MHPRHRLLAAVAPLVHVDGRADPADLVGDRARVGVDAEARLTAGDPQRLEGPQPRGGAGGLGVGRELVARHQLVAVVRRAAGRAIRSRNNAAAPSAALGQLSQGAHSGRG